MSAHYMVLSPAFLQPNGTASARTVQPGTEIAYDEPPSSTLFPLNAEARAARARVLAKRNPQQRIRHDIAIRRAFRGLPKHLRMRCERAAAEAVNDSPETIGAPVVRKKSTRSGDLPQTFPGAWKSQAGKPVASAVLKPR